MPTVIEDLNAKEKFQIFTPSDVINYMLDQAGYISDLYGKKVLENSCGDGAILEQIVLRYISECRRQKFSDSKILNGLQNDITAFEIDKELCAKASARLNKVLSDNGLSSIEWNIITTDFLSTPLDSAFDFIIGNPPYISYADLKEETRQELKKSFISCKKGKFDYCYAFIEKSFKSLNLNGHLVYLIPCYVLKNVHANKVRELIKNDLVTVIEFDEKRVFSNALVTPVIIHAVRGCGQSNLQYRTYGKKMTQTIEKKNLEAKWSFSKYSKPVGVKVSDNYYVSNSIATLCNEAFVVSGGHFENDYYILNDYRIERAILKPTSSPKNKRYGKVDEYIIFPYYMGNDRIIRRFEDEELNAEFPECVKYLQSFNEKLKNRCSDDDAKWFEYGRSQAIGQMNQKKIMISRIISKQTEAYLLSEECIPYSGIYIIPKGDKTLEELLPELNSSKFKEYVNHIGVSVSGQSKRITTHDIEEYTYVSIT